MNDKDLERQKKLDELQEQHRQLHLTKKRLKAKIDKITKSLSAVNKELVRIGGQIFDLKNVHGDVPHITDHAVVRYLERVKGLDIWAIKAEIVQHRDSVRIDNTIVTVNGEENDYS